jgi:hypothetical protein
LVVGEAGEGFHGSPPAVLRVGEVLVVLADTCAGMVITPFAWELPRAVAKRLGGSCAQVGEPGQKEPGRPFGLPRTAAMTRGCRREKASAVGWSAHVRLLRVGSPNPVLESARTAAP